MTPRHKPNPSIADQGGLKAHMVAKGLDYDLFVRMDDTGLDNTAIAKMLGVGRDTVKRWRKLRREENDA